MAHENGNWTIQDSLDLYQIKRWGEGYFGINQDGNLSVNPERDDFSPNINVDDILQEIEKENIQLPFVLRFHDILRSRVRELNATFKSIIEEAQFNGKYCGVFPIKVNQLREVVEEIVDIGQQYDYGLEAGSKAELMTVLAYNTNQNALTILNGYKDKEYLELAALGTLMGRNIVVVIEKFSEINKLLMVIETQNVEVTIGVRAKLSSRASGKWADSSGDFAKFGLTSSEIVQMIELLKEKNKLHLLKLFHFHAGSQIPDIRTIKDCITEGARVFTNIVQMGAPIEYFDVGGGVGINYNGTRSNCASSTNYTLKDYIGDVVYILKDICDVSNAPHPNIVTETGRAIAAHHSCVITNVFGNISLSGLKNIPHEAQASDHMLVRNMKLLYKDLNVSNYQDIYNDACIIKDEINSAFKLGVLNLKEKSFVEDLYWNICNKIINMTENESNVPLEIKKLKSTLADKYLCNFSLFQSAPDSWAIGQILPVIPLKRLNEKPTKECTIADITCDSDGKIDNFVSCDGGRSTLPVHTLNKGERYYLGVFLTGAYQDTMGDMHNLFGRLNEVHVYQDKTDSKGFYIEEVIKGNSSAQVLKIMQYNPEEMCRKVKIEIDKKIKAGSIKPREGVRLNDFYEKSLHNYTYLN